MKEIGNGRDRKSGSSGMKEIGDPGIRGWGNSGIGSTQVGIEGKAELGAYVPSQTTTELRTSLHLALIPVIISSRLSFHLSESTK